MKALDTYNPITIAVYFLAVAGIAMFCMQPILLCLALIGAVTLCILRRDVRNARTHLGFWALFLLAALLNPLLSHNGATVLIVVGNAPITAEAIFWGTTSGAAILSVLYLSCSFGAIMKSDKLLYLFGKLSPRLSLILSMALRYVSLFSEQSKKIRQTQISLGLYKAAHFFDLTLLGTGKRHRNREQHGRARLRYGQAHELFHLFLYRTRRAVSLCNAALDGEHGHPACAGSGHLYLLSHTAPAPCGCALISLLSLLRRTGFAADHS